MPSPIDKIFEEIFGHLPEKAGTAFERLASLPTSAAKEALLKNIIHILQPITN